MNDIRNVPAKDADMDDIRNVPAMDADVVVPAKIGRIIIYLFNFKYLFMILNYFIKLFNSL